MRDSSTVLVRSQRRYGAIRGRRLALAVLTILGLLALPAAAAQADDVWSGLSTAGIANGPHWSDPTNWSGGIVPTNPAGVLTFPDLGACAAPATCYTSSNNLGPITATGLSFTNTTGGYRILGNSISVGSGGITDNPGGTSTQINAPLTLTANQIWTVGMGFGPAYDSLSIIGAVTGSAFTVGVPFVFGPGNGSSGDLFVTSDMEVGQVTVTGSGGLHIGGPAGNGSVNGTNGSGVAINGGATLIANPNSRVGALSVATGGELLLGTGSNNVGAVTLAATGGVSLDSSSSTQTYISNNGATPGTDFSQLTATGNVALGGQLILAQGPSGGGCATLSRGDVATLFTTTGTLSGTFANAGNGAIITMGTVTGSCPSPPQVQINYTPNSVTATVMSGTTPTTTALAAPNPSTAATNQPVTLTATVTTTSSGTVAPAGTVAFASSGTEIPGCTAQPVTPTGGSSGTATCTTSFPAASSPESLTAAFTGTVASGQGSSISAPPQSLTVTKASSATALTVSNKSPVAGGSVTYTATVTPGVGGPTKPSGAVQFRDGGTAIAGCGGRPLTAGASSSTATCTVTYPSAGSHSIIAGYGGDGSFGPSSSSPAAAVNVQSPPPKISASTSAATHLGTTQATLNGTVGSGGATVTWKFEYGQRTAYNHATSLQTITAGHGTVSVSSVVKHLSPNVRYHYRLVASAGGATINGKDRTFTTKATGSLLFSARRLSVFGRTILVSEKCQSKVLCTGRFSLSTRVHVAKKKKLATVICASGSFRIKAHRTASARVRLSGACLRLLRPHRRLSVTYTSQTRTGQKGLSRRITLALR